MTCSLTDKSLYTPLIYNQVTSLQQTVHNNSNTDIQLLLLHTPQKPKVFTIQYKSNLLPHQNWRKL